MNTLENVIKAWENCIGPDAECCDHCEYTQTDDNGESYCIKCRLEDETLYYLKQLYDARHILTDGRIVDYWGKLPVIAIGDQRYTVREYLPKNRAWRCSRVSWTEIHQGWSTDDDDNYIIDRDGKILYKEVGWELREVPIDCSGSEKNQKRGHEGSAGAC